VSRNLYFEVTNVCNYHCSICPYRNSPRKPAYFATESEILRIFSVGNSIQSVTLSGGEPFLHPEISSIINLLIKRKVSITVLTNASLIAKHREIKEIIERVPNHLLTIVTAIHGDNSQYHDSITGIAGSFDDSMSSIAWLSDKGKNVTIKLIINSQNAPMLSSIGDLIYSKFGTHVRILLCGMDICGLSSVDITMNPIDYQYESSYVNKFFTECENRYGSSIDRFVSFMEYPLCYVDPYYWSLMQNSNNSSVAYIDHNHLSSSDDVPITNRCLPHGLICNACIAKKVCPGIWYSVYSTYGEKLLRKINN